MPYAVSGDCRIAYDVIGEGPTVVLQAGLATHRREWARFGYVAALADRYQVVSVDSLGHGDSDRPRDKERYRQAHRAADVVAVLDDLGVTRAHLAGYSMGAWVASAVLVHHPSRLASVVFGGWDPVGGLATNAAVGLAKDVPLPTFEGVLAEYRRRYPACTDWVLPEVEPVLRRCIWASQDTTGVEAAMRDFDAPILLWVGADDAPRDACRVLAANDHVELLEVPGDHLETLFADDGRTKAALRTFFDGAEDAYNRTSM